MAITSSDLINEIRSKGRRKSPSSESIMLSYHEPAIKANPKAMD
jgi:hypothetical protein